MIEFFVGGVPRYLNPDSLQVFTEDEYNEMIATRVKLDFEQGTEIVCQVIMTNGLDIIVQMMVKHTMKEYRKPL